MYYYTKSSEFLSRRIGVGCGGGLGGGGRRSSKALDDKYYPD